MNSPCMVGGKCSKFYPKEFVDTTNLDRDGYPIYRRRDDGRFIEKNGFKCDNTYVVPYNRKLSLKYRAHINVEWCNQTGSVKYLFKYVHKGQDRVTVSVEAGQEEDETEYTSDGVNINSSKKKDDVQDFFDCRYVSACEAFWRTNQYPIHYRTTPVVKLTFHEEGKQPVFYKDGDKPTTVLNRPTLDHTMFTAWFELCLRDEEARKLTYEQIPNKYIYDKKEKEFRPRGRTGFSIGRINYVPHNLEDSYHLRILINSKKGPTSFNDIKTVKGVLYKTYKEACFALGLLDDDKEYIEGIKEANFWCSSKFCRRLFVIMLISESLTSPKTVWEETWKILSEDIERKEKQRRQRPDTEKKKLLLRELQKLMKRNGCSLQKYKLMPHISLEDVTLPNQLILDELNYNREDLAKKHDGWKKMLTEEQKKIYDEIMEAVINDKGGVFFLYGFGGTGKTFLWKVLSAAIRSNGHIVLNSASSGIASLLLEGGRTAHSRFALPLNPNETSTCNMSRSSELGALVKEAKLIIWDEAPMMSKYCFETLDRSLKDIMRSKEDKLFGGKVVLFGGDFRQILPVIVGAGREAIVNASLNSSYLWNQCKVLRLTKNMRLLQDIGKQEASEIEEFSKWILAVGEGKINEPNDGVCEIDIPQELLIPEGSSPLESIIEAVYGKNFATQKDPKFFQERAILCPTNEDVNSINDVMLSSLNAEERIYLSSDSIDPQDKRALKNKVYSPDFLNTIKVSGIPYHRLRLKIGCPIMLMRNIDPHGGLMNGTRLQITQMADHVLQARILTGTRVGKIVLIPRMLISPSDTRLPFKMRRRQFPVSVAFAMTINKSQGQSLENVGIYLPRPVFSHGQLYVAMSRVKSKSGLKMLITDAEGKPQTKTTNVVFKEVFQNLH
ncbi:PREDICTED: uncharacterized protein LOC104773570 [Camelina sativa]|uniref:ATP-dependent DNA helicase n=1 Tax=Camelina sativa TaxID=90675 RepID=A0ABM0Y6Z6_CAMSA|nr:PREDICTED: uncharacterized protein LOC104773570 [Camelina sativa]